METAGANLRGVRSVGTEGLARQNGGVTKPGEPGFREQLTVLSRQPGPARPEALGQAPGTGTLRFSNHAIDRMQSRGIRFAPGEMERILGAVAKAAGKGSKNALLISDSAALIVSVKDNTVVTVMDKASLKENVFTNIDSTVMI